jgi:2-polyprenyl-3-methyl-5-hydroxy-6-metoxy-1,4-benzoquinol methylase
MSRDLKNYQEQYQALPFEDTQVIYRKKNILESVVKFQPSTLLEIGCGNAPFFNEYQNFEQFVVVEPCELFYENAKQVSSNDSRIAVYKGTVQDQIEQLQTYQYDFILLSSLLHEVADYRDLLMAVKKLCHPRTVIHIKVPNAKSFHRLLALEMGLVDSIYQKSETQNTMQQSHTFDLEQLAVIIDEMDFEVLNQGSFFIKPFTHAQSNA